MTDPKFTMTQDSITVVLNGETHSIKRGDPDFEAVRKAVYEGNWDVIPGLCSKGHTVASWLSSLGEGYDYEDNVILFQGDPLPVELNSRMIQMVQEKKDPKSLAKFWELLQGNPSHRSVTQLYQFLSHNNIPIDEDGYILAYKAVRTDYKDIYTGKIDNSVGQVVSMPRNKISDDPSRACDTGLHVGAISYVRSYGGDEKHVLICRVHPADVVSVPLDHNGTKMRVCRYEVMGHYGADLPNTTYDEDWEGEDLDWDEDEESEDPILWGDEDEEDEDLDEEEEAVHWLNFNDLSMDDLEDRPLSDIRKYARHVLNIIGASKIPGGKDALLGRIRQVRKGT